MRMVLHTKRIGRAESSRKELRRSGAVAMLGTMAAAAANVDAEDVDEAGGAVAKDNVAGMVGYSSLATK